MKKLECVYNLIFFQSFSAFTEAEFKEDSKNKWIQQEVLCVVLGKEKLRQ